MTLTIIQKGFASSVQDMGRPGYQRYGIIVGGVMDRPSASLANWLVGNPETAALIEFSFLGPAILFTEPALFAVTGAYCRPKLNNRDIHPGHPYFADEGQILTIGGLISGSRGYVAVAGGIDTPLWLGSRSTSERAGKGGYKGRRLKETDQLPVGKPSKVAEELMQRPERLAGKWYYAFRRTYRGRQTVRVMPDTLWPQFSKKSRVAFLSTDYRVTGSSDRMGYRLSGEKLMLDQPIELYSEAVTEGSIQVPGNGQPIILMTDHQSTGGYPRIAQVVSADLPLLAQLPPNSLLHFKKIAAGEAEQLLMRQRIEMEQLHTQIDRRLKLLVNE
ncbi:biotin-dependent carboxyltransferase family protein [Sporolactobacillus sp. Y61]|uniref:Biotin-dependent carboxyltransferase family protein n=1 Tax=Sporolactobacillus sp. Y61 TaxID=3160863 RepID=A0AAU8IID7_9BACL